MKLLLLFALVFIGLSQFINTESALELDCSDIQLGATFIHGRCYPKILFSVEVKTNRTHAIRRLYPTTTNCTGDILEAAFEIKCKPSDQGGSLNVWVTPKFPEIKLEPKGLFYKVYLERDSKCKDGVPSETLWGYKDVRYYFDQYCMIMTYNDQTQVVDVERRENGCEGELIGRKTFKTNTCIADAWIPNLTYIFSRTPF